jgi:primosomal protein N' (replication factor Y)
MSQVTGRAGRGEKPGRVVIQTFQPDHYSIVTARNHDYSSLYEKEIALRKTLAYPPFSR